MADVILGAGIAGLGAYHANTNLKIYEKDDLPGGLCGNFVIKSSYGDFCFDKAVHLSFASDKRVRKIFDRIGHYEYYPVPFSWYNGQWVQHPIQNNLYPLETEEKIKAVKSFVERIPNENADNFEEWTLQQYGTYLYENMFKLYNEKYWCINLNELSIDWIGNRLYQPTLEEVLYGSYTDKTPNTYYAKEMRYPHKGGYYSFISDIADMALENKKLYLNKNVEKIDMENKRIEFTDGEIIEYTKIYSSIPLPDMIKLIGNVPDNISKCVNELQWTSVALVSFGFNEQIVVPNIWFYIYDKDIFAARAYTPSGKSKCNVPNGCSSIQFEIYFNSRDVKPNKEKCINNCLYAIEKMGIANNNNIIFSDFRIEKYANVIFTKQTNRFAKSIKQWLKQNEIIPIGRFGSWEYLWSDQAFLSGYERVISS